MQAAAISDYTYIIPQELAESVPAWLLSSADDAPNEVLKEAMQGLLIQIQPIAGF